MMPIDVRRLMVLCAVRDGGGILRASELLHITPSAVSQQLAKLERETGIALVTRTAHTAARLTAAGLRLAERGDTIAAELREAEHDLEAFSLDQRSVVRVAAFPSAMQALLVPLAARFAGLFTESAGTMRKRPGAPEVVLHLAEARQDPAIQLAQLRGGELDLVIAKRDGAAPFDHGITESVLVDDPYRLVIPSTWPMPRSMMELLKRPWVGHPTGSPGRDALDRVEQTEEVELVTPYECTEYSVALSYVEAGLAAAIVPEMALRAHRGGFEGTRPQGLPGVNVVQFGDLGHRRIVAQHRPLDREGLAVRVVLDELLARHG